MATSQVSPYSTIGVTATLLTPAVKSNQTSYQTPYQTTKTTVLTTPKAYTVELSGSALVRSLKLEGFTASMISVKTGYDAKTVNQYLGITESAANTTIMSTYTPPKRAYTDPELLILGRAHLAQDLYQLAISRYSWSTIMNQLMMNQLPTTGKKA